MCWNVSSILLPYTQCAVWICRDLDSMNFSAWPIFIENLNVQCSSVKHYELPCLDKSTGSLRWERAQRGCSENEWHVAEWQKSCVKRERGRARSTCQTVYIKRTQMTGNWRTYLADMDRHAAPGRLLTSHQFTGLHHSTAWTHFIRFTCFCFICWSWWYFTSLLLLTTKGASKENKVNLIQTFLVL